MTGEKRANKIVIKYVATEGTIKKVEGVVTIITPQKNFSSEFGAAYSGEENSFVCALIDDDFLPKEIKTMQKEAILQYLQAE